MTMRAPQSMPTLQLLRLLWHLPNFAKLYWRLFTDRRVPLHAKAVLLAGVLYILSPIDLIPFLLFPVFGAADDLAIFLLTARVFISLCPPNVVQEQVRKISQE
jgi:uncharacterized membrane protein YkvA (DUF1232 family)